MKILEPVLGTRAEVAVVAECAAAAAVVEQAVLEEVARLEQIFTVFDEASALNELRRIGSTNVSELLIVGALAERWTARSGGLFDPGVQSLMTLWDQAEETATLPTAADLDAALAAGTPSLDNLNAIAKGWIAQAAVDVGMTQSDVDRVWLSLGGDVVHGGTGSLSVGIEDPHRPYDNVAPFATIEVSNEALATSGGARRWWTIDNERYAKVLDPRTARPVDHIASATVVAGDGATADVLATIALVADPEETLALVQETGAECLLVLTDTSRISSSDRFILL